MKSINMCKLSVFNIALILIFVRDSWTYDYFDEEYNDPTISAESGTNEIRSEEEKYFPQNHRDSGDFIEVKILNRDDEKENKTESVEIEVVANSTDRNIDVYLDDVANITSSKTGQCKHNLSNAVDGSEEERASTTLINYPFAVSIQRKGSHYATGALLDKRWILTVAGEFYNIRETIKLFRARLGSVDNKRGGLLVPLKRVVIHPAYVYGQPNYDLAMLRIGHPVDYTDFIRPIRLSRLANKIVGGKFMTAYWPRLIVKGSLLPMTAKERIRHSSLRVSIQRLIPPTTCDSMMQVYNMTLDHSTLCLKQFVSYHSVCTPDAGAPIVSDDGLWGITSGWIADGCLANPSPTLFTRISSRAVRSWLDTQLLDVST